MTSLIYNLSISKVRFLFFWRICLTFQNVKQFIIKTNMFNILFYVGIIII
jgi:hypothetical protein